MSIVSNKSAKHRAKRDEIILAGMEVLYQHGYNGTSVKDIVQAAGIPKGSFYFYFDSKEAFAMIAMERYLEQSNVELDRILDRPDRDVKKRLTDFYNYRIRHNIERLDCPRGCLVNNLASEMSSSNETLRKAVQALFKRSVHKIATLIKQGQKEGLITNRSDAVKLASTIEDAWKGAMVTMKACQCKEPLLNFRNIILKNLLY